MLNLLCSTGLCLTVQTTLIVNWVCCCLQVSSGAWQQLRENLALAKIKKPQELGVDGAVPPDPVAIEKISHKFLNMRKMYSPEKKVSLLLRVCKLIYTIMQDNSGMEKSSTLHVTEILNHVRPLSRRRPCVTATLTILSVCLLPSREDVWCR